MSAGLIVLIAVAALLLVALWAVVTYNVLIGSRNKVDEGWSGIDVQLKRRHELIPNLVEAVKGYAAHERETLQAVTTARSDAVTASGPAASGVAEGVLGQALGRLFAVAEAYPELRAAENFQRLQAELVDTEDQIAAARRIYNGNVQIYNTRIQVFPNVLIASMAHFEPRVFFEIADAAEREPEQVDLAAPSR
jgi:LemA protein